MLSLGVSHMEGRTFAAHRVGGVCVGDTSAYWLLKGDPPANQVVNASTKSITTSLAKYKVSAPHPRLGGGVFNNGVFNNLSHLKPIKA